MTVRPLDAALAGPTDPPADRPMRRPRRLRLVPRIRMRTLMVLVLAIGGGLGWVVHRAKVQRDAVATIERAGLSVQYRWNWAGSEVASKASAPPWPMWLVEPLGPDYFGDVVAVYSNGGRRDQVDDEVMARIGSLGRLEILGFGTLRLVDDQLAQLAGLTGLDQLDLSQSEIRGPGLAHLKKMKKLKHLNLCMVPVTDDTLAYLSPLVALEDLSFCTCEPVTDAGLVHLEGLVNLRGLSFHNGSQITTKGLNSLRRMRQLWSLGLTGSRVDSLEPIAQLGEMRYLNLSESPLDDRGLRHLAGYKKLRTLKLTPSKSHPERRIGDETLANIKGLDQLVDLEVSGAGITDSGLANLKGLSKLQRLNLDRTKVGDAGLAQLAGLTSLNFLSLNFTKLTDAGLAHISGLTAIDNLSIYHTSITDAGLEEVAKLTGCRRLLIRETQVTPNGVASLQAKLPSMRISQ